VGPSTDKDALSKQCREICHLNDIYFHETKNPLRGKYVSSRHLQQRFARLFLLGCKNAAYNTSFAKLQFRINIDKI